MDGNIVLPHKKVNQDFHDLMKLKEKDPCLRILISVGGEHSFNFISVRLYNERIFFLCLQVGKKEVKNSHL